MQELIPGTTEASGEKHIPVYEVSGNTVDVTVGMAEHPMTAEHYIEWVCLETERGIQYAHLTPNDASKATFSICDGDKVQAVYAFCNQHNFWRGQHVNDQ